MNRVLPTRIDRYPAKMVSHLAERLVYDYTEDCTSLLDPFCGSGAILTAAHQKGISVTGIDINPYATLLTNVKLKGFSYKRAKELCMTLIENAKSSSITMPIEWDNKDYWFTKGTIIKFEKLRSAAKELQLHRTCDGRAVLLSLALSVRRCSRADQRSPKPFISKIAVAARKGRHYDPYREMSQLLHDLGEVHYCHQRRTESKVLMLDIKSEYDAGKVIGKHSHVITSPPYINAQDYFRNFKLELYVLEGLLPFNIRNIKEYFIGTERGELIAGYSNEMMKKHRLLIPQLKNIDKSNPRISAVIHRYIYDMGEAFDRIKTCLRPGGLCVVVCGDNLIGGFHIRTWKIINTILEERGFRMFNSFTDKITQRMLPPKRCGHKGLIKEEVIAAFRLS